MSDNISNIGSAIAAPVTSTGQAPRSAQTGPSTSQSPAAALSSTIPPWLEEQYAADTQLLEEARRIYSGELAYYYIPQNDQFGPALYVGREGSERSIFLDPNNKSLAALELLYRTVCANAEDSLIDNSNLIQSLKTYLKDFAKELKEKSDELRDALAHPEHRLNQDPAQNIISIRKLVTRTASLLGIELAGIDLTSYQGLKAALDKILDSDQFQKLGEAGDDQMVELASKILALKVGDDNAELAEINGLAQGIKNVLDAIKNGQGEDRLSLNYAAYPRTGILRTLTRTTELPGIGEAYIMGSVDISGELPAFLKTLAGTMGIIDFAGFIAYLDNPADQAVLIDRSFVEANLALGGISQEPSDLPGEVIGAFLPSIAGETTLFLAGDLAYFYTGEERHSGEGVKVLVLGIGLEGHENLVYLDQTDHRLQALYNFFFAISDEEVNSENLKNCLEEYLKNILAGFTQEGQISDLADRLGIDIWGRALPGAVADIRQGLADVDIIKLISTVAHYLALGVNSSPESIEELFTLIKDGTGDTESYLAICPFDPKTMVELEKKTIGNIEGLWIFGENLAQGHLPANIAPEDLQAMSAGQLIDVNFYRGRLQSAEIPTAIRLPLELNSDPAVKQAAFRFFTNELEYRYVAPYAGPEVVGILGEGENSQLISLGSDPLLSPLKLFYQRAFEDITIHSIVDARRFNGGLREYLNSQADELQAVLDILSLLEQELQSNSEEAEQLQKKIQDIKYQYITVLQVLADHFDLPAFNPGGDAGSFALGLAQIIDSLEGVDEDDRREVVEKMLAAETGLPKSNVHEILDLVAEGRIKIGQRQFENGRIYELDRKVLDGIKIGGFEVRALVYSNQPLPEQLSPLLQIMGNSLFGSAAQTYESFCNEVYERANDGLIDANFFEIFSGEDPNGQLRVFFHQHEPANDRERVAGSGKFDFRVYAGNELLIRCEYQEDGQEPVSAGDASDPRLQYLWEQLSRYNHGQEFATDKERFTALYNFYVENQEQLSGGRGEISEQAGTFEQAMAFNLYMRDFASLGNEEVEKQILTRARELARDLTLSERQLMFLTLSLMMEGKVLKPGSETEWVEVTADGEAQQFLTDADLAAIINSIHELRESGTEGISFTVNGASRKYYWRPDTYAAAFRVVDRIGQAPATRNDMETINGLAEFIHNALLPKLQDISQVPASDKREVSQLQNMAGIAIYGPFMNPAVDDAHTHIILQGLSSMLASINESQQLDLEVRQAYSASAVSSIDIDAHFLTTLLEQTNKRCRLGPIAFELALEDSRLIRAARSMGSRADAYSILLGYAGKTNLSAQEVLAVLNAQVDLRKLATKLAPQQTVAVPEALADLYFDIDRLTHKYFISEEQPTEGIDISPWEPSGAQPVAVPQTGTAGLYLAGVSSLTQDDLGKLANLWLYAFTMHPSAIPQQEWEAMAAYFGAESVDQIPLGDESRRDFINLLHRVPAFLTPSLIRGLGQLYRPRFYTFLSISDLGSAALKKIRDNNWFGLSEPEKSIIELLLNQKVNEMAGEEGLLSKIISEENKAGLQALLARLDGLLAGNTGNDESARALKQAVAALKLYLIPSNIAPIQQEAPSAADLQALQGLADLIDSGRLTINGQIVRGVASFEAPQGLSCSAADRQIYEKGITALRNLSDRVARATFVEPPAEIQVTDMSSFFSSLWSSIHRGYSTTIVPYVAEEQLLNGPEAGTIRTFKTIMYLDCIINPTPQFAQDRAAGLSLISERDAAWTEIERLRNEQAQYRLDHEGAESPETKDKLNSAIRAFKELSARFESFINEIKTRMPNENDGTQTGVRLMCLKFLAEGYRTLAKAKELDKEQEVEVGVNNLLVEMYGTTSVNVFQRAEATQRYLSAHGRELDDRYSPIFEDLNQQAVDFETKFTLLYQNLNSDTVDALFVKTFDKLFGGVQAADGSRTDYGIFEWNFDPYLPQISGAAYMATIEGDHGEIRSGRELRNYIVKLFENNSSLQWASLSSSKDDLSTEARARRALTYVLMLMPRENVEFNSLNAVLSLLGNFAERTSFGSVIMPAVGVFEAGMEVWGASDEFSVTVGPNDGHNQQSYLNNLRQTVNNQGNLDNLPNPLACISEPGGSDCLGLFAEHSRASYMAALMLRGYSVPDSRMRFNMAGIASLFFGEQIDLTNPLDQQTIGLREVENALQSFNNLRRRVEDNDEAKDSYLNLVEQGKVNTGLLNAGQEAYLMDPVRAADALVQLKNYLRAHPELRFRLYDDINAASVLEEWGVTQDDPWFGSLALGLLVLSRLVIDYSALTSAIMPGERLSATGELDAASGYSPADTFRIYRVQGEGNQDNFVVERVTPTGQTVTAITPTAERLRQESGGNFLWDGINTYGAVYSGLAQNAGHIANELPVAFDEAFLKGFEFGATIPASIFAQFTQIITKAKDLAQLYVLSESAEDPNAREYYRGVYNSLYQQFWSVLGQTYGSFLAFEMIPWVMLKEVEDLLDNEQYGLAAGLATVAVPFAIQILKKDAMFVNQLLRFLTNEDVSSAVWNRYGLASAPLSVIQNILRRTQRVYRRLGRLADRIGTFIMDSPGMDYLAERYPRLARTFRAIGKTLRLLGKGYMGTFGGLEVATGIISRDGITGGAERAVRGIFGLPQPQIVGLTHRRLEVDINPIQLINELKSILNGRRLGGRISRTLNRLIKDNPQLKVRIEECLKWFSEALGTGMDIEELKSELQRRVEAIFEGIPVDQSVKDAVVRRVNRFLQNKFNPGRGRRAAARGGRLIGRLVSTVNDLLGFRWGGFRDLSRVEARVFEGRNPSGPGAVVGRGIRAGEILARAGSAIRDGAREALQEMGFEGATLDALTAEYSRRYMSQGLGLINPLPIGEQIEQAQEQALQGAIAQKSIDLIAGDVGRLLRVPASAQTIETWLKGELPKVLNGTLGLEELITQLKAKIAELLQGIPGTAELTEKLQKKAEKIIRSSLTEEGLSESVQTRALSDKSYLRRAIRAARRQVMNAFRNNQQSRARDYVMSQEISSRLSNIPVEVEPGMPAPSEDNLRIIREAVDSIPADARRGLKILITREGFALVGRDLERAFRWDEKIEGITANGVRECFAGYRIEMDPQLTLTEDKLVQIQKMIEIVPEEYRSGIKIIVTEEGFQIKVAGSRAVSDRWSTVETIRWEGSAVQAPPAAPAEPIIRWDALAEGVAIRVADNVRNPHELAFTAEHQAQVKQAIENLRRLGAQFTEGLEIEISEEGFRLVGDRYTSSDPTPWEKPVRREPVEGGQGGAAAPLSILTPLAVLSRPNAEPVQPTPSLEAEIAAQLEGVSMVDSQGNVLDEAARTAKIADIARAASEHGFTAIDLSVIEAAAEHAQGLDDQARSLAQVNADKLLEFVSQDRSSGSRVLIAATPENFYSIGGFEGADKIELQVRGGTYRFVNNEDGTVLAEYELRDGYKLEQTYQVQGDNRLAERLGRDIARQARQLEVKILEPFYRSLGESEVRIRVRQFLANNPWLGSAAASLTMQGSMLGAGAVGAWWANGLIDALAGDDPEARIKYAPVRFIATLVSFEGFSRLAEMTFSELLTGQTPAWISGPSALEQAVNPNVITGVEGFGVFTAVMHGYDLVLNGLDVSEDSLLRSQWVSLPIGAVANHLLLTAFTNPEGKLGWMARGAEQLFGENWAKFLSVWGTRALKAIGTVGAIASAMPVGLELGASVSSWISSDVADFETDIVDSARATYPTAQNVGSFIFGETVSACFINLVSRFSTDITNLITGGSEDGDIRDVYQAAREAMIAAESSKVEEMSQMIWQALEEAYVGYLAANPLLLMALNSDNMDDVKAMFMRDMFEMFSHLPPQLTEMIAAVRERISQLREMNDGQYVMGTYSQRIGAFFSMNGSLDTHSQVAGIALVPVWDEGPQMLNLLLEGRTEEISEIMDEQENYLAYEMFLRMSQGADDLETYRVLGFINENDELNLENEHVKRGLEMFKTEQRAAIVNRLAYLMSREFSGHTLYSEEDQNNYFMCEMDQWLGLVVTDGQGILRTNQNEQNEWLSGIIDEAGQKILNGQAGAQSNTGDEVENLVRNLLAVGFMADPQAIGEQLEQLDLTPEAIAEKLQSMIEDGSLLHLARERREVNRGVGEDRVNLGRIRLTYLLYIESCGADSVPAQILRAYLTALEGGEQYDDSWMSRPGTRRAAQSYLAGFKTAIEEIKNGENVEDNALELSSLFWKTSSLASLSDF
ncbi:hypothetical protein HZC35_05360 [Candidatus Saganbacteria bacterium]|nr:hypothetical protein [Candidatus Saganbacteria bacterium]